jgi:hypothetical protein
MTVLFKDAPPLRSLGRLIRTVDRVRLGIVIAYIAVTTFSFVAHSGDAQGFVVDFVFATVTCGASLLVFHEE